MFYFILKIFISAVLIALISEVAKRHSLIGAALASLPLTSLLAMLWLYWETGNSHVVAKLSQDIFWLVIPSLALFIAFPFFIKRGMNFYLSLSSSVIITTGCYFLLIGMMKIFK